MLSLKLYCFWVLVVSFTRLVMNKTCKIGWSFKNYAVYLWNDVNRFFFFNGFPVFNRLLFKGCHFGSCLWEIFYFRAFCLCVREFVCFLNSFLFGSPPLFNFSF